ncbi:MAG: REP-associated tyrosine transposase [Pseudomonadota bacterium]
MLQAHSGDLRKGRRSLPGHAYLLTLVTHQRQPIFLDFSNAAAACRNFYASGVQQHGTTLSFVVMPDHVHWLVQLHGQLSVLVRVYKARVSMDLGRRIWQPGYHDRGLRQEDDIRRFARYIVANPLRAGLVDDIRQYPYWDAVWL